MRNLYTVTITQQGRPLAPLHVLAATETAAIRKAIKVLFGGIASAPVSATYSATLTADRVIC